MLVLSRKPKETIQIGDNITVTILNFKGGAVRIGIDAPKEVKIKRGQCHAPAGSLEITTERK